MIQSTVAFKCLESVKKKNTFIQQGCIKLIKSDSKDFYTLQKVLQFPLKYEVAQQFSTLILILSQAANRHIKTINEKSCDTVN